MYPVVPMNVRIIPDECSLSGYKIPKGVRFFLYNIFNCNAIDKLKSYIHF